MQSYKKRERELEDEITAFIARKINVKQQRAPVEPSHIPQKPPLTKKALEMQ